MKTFLATLALLAAFTINAIAQSGDPGINPNTVSPAIPGAPPTTQDQLPGNDPAGGALVRPGTFNNGTDRNTAPKVDQTNRSCDNLSGTELMDCRAKYANPIRR